MPKSIAHQVTALYEILQHEFALLPTGRQLPAYRALLKKYGCSRQTLSRTLQLLIENGVIYSEERSGIFASGKFTSDLYRILFIRVDWCCEHADRFSEAIRREISKRRNFHYIELRYPPQNCDSFYVRFCQVVFVTSLVFSLKLLTFKANIPLPMYP